MKHLAVCIPHLNNISKETYRSLNILLSLEGYKFDFFEIISTNLAHSRNLLAKNSKNYHRLLFIDSDIFFNKEDVIQLLNHNLSIIGGAYEVNGLPELITAGNWGSVIGMPQMLPKSSVGLHKVNMIGMGFAAIKSDVFKILPEPWFMGEVINTSNGKVISNEDIGFFLKCQRANLNIYIDTDIKVGHKTRPIETRTILERINNANT